MSDQEFLKSAIKEISSEFAGLLKESNRLSEERHSKTDGKLDRLIDAIAENTLELRETRKEQEYTAKRQERIEQNQKELGEESRHIAEQILLINERQNNAKSKSDKFSDIGHKVAIWIILAYLGYTTGIKP